MNTKFKELILKLQQRLIQEHTKKNTSKNFGTYSLSQPDPCHYQESPVDNWETETMKTDPNTKKTNEFVAYIFTKN